MSNMRGLSLLFIVVRLKIIDRTLFFCPTFQGLNLILKQINHVDLST